MKVSSPIPSPPLHFLGHLGMGAQCSCGLVLLESATFNPFFPEPCNANANSQCSAFSTFQMHSYDLASCAVLLPIAHHGRTEHTAAEPLPSYSTRGRGFSSKVRLLFPDQRVQLQRQTAFPFLRSYK